MSLYEGPVFRVERREGRDVVVHAPVAAVVALDRDHVTLVRQRRVPVDATLLELPAGFIDECEPPLRAAQRELIEETGLHGGDWVELATFFTSAGFTDEQLHLFLATDLEPGEASPDADEELEVVRVPLADVPGLIDECRDAKTLIGLLLLARRRGVGL
ncbi:MAG TPA: NUDIX hydrolase [Gaiellaceae bacterium]|nr:NUDIX hydrolase [Gaiellaceae bacterium]